MFRDTRRRDMRCKIVRAAVAVWCVPYIVLYITTPLNPHGYMTAQNSTEAAVVTAVEATRAICQMINSTSVVNIINEKR